MIEEMVNTMNDHIVVVLYLKQFQIVDGKGERSHEIITCELILVPALLTMTHTHNNQRRGEREREGGREGGREREHSLITTTIEVSGGGAERVQ